MEQYGIMLNEDPNHFLGTRSEMCGEIDRAYLERFIDQYKDTQVTDLMFCVNSAVPSKYFTFYGDKYHVTEEAGQTVDYKEHCIVKPAYVIWYEKKLDLYEIWMNQCRKDGIRPWLSFRMNDAHSLYQVPSALHHQFFYDHIHSYARVRHRGQYQHFDRCRDYRIEAVRRQYLGYMEEMLERYNPYGVEIDFQRELDCFEIGWESRGLAIMTEFMQNVKAVAQAAEKRWGHAIKICVRCNPEPRYCMEYGFDIIEWAKQGLMDVFVPTARFGTTDNDMPIRLWKQILEPYGVTLAGGVEMLLGSNPKFQPGGELPLNTLETAAGSAAYLFSQGADKLYLYNMMDQADTMMFGKHRQPTEETGAITGAVYYKLLTTLGTPEGAITASRRHVVTYQDHNPIWRTQNAQLPLALTTQEDYRLISALRIVTGKILPEQTVTLKLGIPAHINPQESLEIYVNSRPVAFTGTQNSVTPLLTRSEIYCFHIDNEGDLPGEQIVELFYKDRPLTVDYAEIAVQ